jgi:hypothetical protein
MGAQRIAPHILDYHALIASDARYAGAALGLDIQVENGIPVKIGQGWRRADPEMSGVMIEQQNAQSIPRSSCSTALRLSWSEAL